MKAAFLALATVLAWGAALAQETAPVVVQSAGAFEPSWEPSSLRRSRFAQAYPEDALRRGMAGIVHLCCDARADRGVDCRVALEWPERGGFGAVALRMFRGNRLTPESYAALQARPSTTFQVPIQWHEEPAPGEPAGITQRAHDAARDLCGPNTGEAPEYTVISATKLH